MTEPTTTVSELKTNVPKEMSNPAVDKMTLELLLNKNYYQKYLSKNDPKKYQEHQEYLQKIKTFKHSITYMTTEMLNDHKKTYTNEINEAFTHYCQTLIRHLEIKKFEPNQNKTDYYEDENTMFAFDSLNNVSKSGLEIEREIEMGQGQRQNIVQGPGQNMVQRQNLVQGSDVRQWFGQGQRQNVVQGQGQDARQWLGQTQGQTQGQDARQWLGQTQGQTQGQDARQWLGQNVVQGQNAIQGQNAVQGQGQELRQQFIHEQELRQGIEQGFVQWVEIDPQIQNVKRQTTRLTMNMFAHPPKRIT